MTNILEIINESLDNVEGGEGNWVKVPKTFPEYQPLRGKKITLVDDQADIIDAFIPHLVMATHKMVTGVWHRGQRVEELVDEIIKSSPDIILVDWQLSNGIVGSEVIDQLGVKGISGRIFIFSSASRNFVACRSVGKNVYNHASSVRELARMIKDK